MTRLAKLVLLLAALAGLTAGLRRLWRLADPDASVYGHPALPRHPGP